MLSENLTRTLNSIRKERLLPGYSGYSSDLLKAGGSGIYETEPLSQWLESELLARDQTGYLARSIAVSDTPSNTTGEETLYSTVRPKPEFNRCHHRKIQGVNLPYTYAAVLDGYDGTRTFVTAFNRASSYYKIGSVPFSGVDAIDDDMVKGFSERAWYDLQPRFEGRAQMLNFLYELKDFKSAAKGMSRLFNRAGRTGALRKAKQILRDPKTYYDPTAPAASAWLTNQMAIQPLLSDFSAIQESLMQTVNKAQDDFGALGDQEQTSHYTEVFQDDQYSDPVSEAGYDPVIHYLNRKKVSATATMSYDYSYRPRTATEAFKKYWGLNVTGEVLWNMIPLSFLLDYFIKIGQSLHSMDYDRNVDVNVIQYSESTLRFKQYGFAFYTAPHVLGTVLDGKYYEPGAQTNHLINGYLESDYIRRPCSPSKWGLYKPIIVSKVSNNHMMNMAALARCFV